MNIDAHDAHVPQIGRRAALARLGLGLAAAPLVLGPRRVGAAGIEPPAPTRMKLLASRKIWAEAPHNAFTGLVRHQGRFVCVFREADAHIPGIDGTIRVLGSDDGQSWSSLALLEETGVDLRDPKLDVMPDGRLMLLMGGSVYGEAPGKRGRKFQRARTRVAFSKDGSDWTKPAPVSVEGQWLWRVTWHEQAGYGFGYRLNPTDDASGFTLWKTTDGIDYARVADPKLPAGTQPNETTIRFLADGSMVALARSESQPRHAFIGTSRAPFTDWRWSDGGHPAQGPDFLVLGDGRMLYAGRDFPDGARTVVGVMSTEELTPLLTLPSGGDTSYPGLVWHDGKLWVCYYASHEARTSIYLAEIAVEPT